MLRGELKYRSPFRKKPEQVKLFLGSWAFNALMSVIFAQQFSRVLAGALCVFYITKEQAGAIPQTLTTK